MVAERVTSLPVCVSEVCLAGSSLHLLQRIRRGLGCLSGKSLCSEPLASRGQSVHQPARVEVLQAGSAEFVRPIALPSPGCVLQQCHYGGLPHESREMRFPSGLRGSVYPPLGREGWCHRGSSVCDGQEEPDCRLSQLFQSGDWFGMVSERPDFPGSVEEVAGDS